MSIHPIGSAAFRDALARFASGVTVVTAASEKGPVGFTATGFSSVSLTPPLVLVCVGRRSSAHEGVVTAARFGVSILSENQAWIAEQFARSGVDRFLGVPVVVERVPFVSGAAVLLECRHHAYFDAGDHTILVGEVLTSRIGGGAPLLHCARRFGTFRADTPLAAESNSTRGGRDP